MNLQHTEMSIILTQGSVHDTDNNSQSQDQPDVEPEESTLEVPTNQERSDESVAQE